MMHGQNNDCPPLYANEVTKYDKGCLAECAWFLQLPLSVSAWELPAPFGGH